MKLLFKVLAIGLLPSICTAKEGTPNATNYQQPKPVFFMENKGQIIDQDHKQRTDIDYNLVGKGVVVFVGDGQLHYQFSRLDNAAEREKLIEEQKKDPKRRDEVMNDEFTTYRVDVELVGANKDAAVVTDGRQDYYEMYYNEYTPAEGARAGAYGKVTYKNVYPNIDWVLYSKNGQFKYEFIVRPGGKVSDIKLKFDGASSMKINENGSLTIATPLGTISDDVPVSFDETGKVISTPFALSNNILGFNVNGDHSGTLTIDPTVTWGTYYGGSSTDYAIAVSSAPDGSAIYMVGYTFSTNNIATTGSHQASISTTADGYLVKFNALGVRQWGTYYGGSGGTDYAFDVAQDATGNVFVTGRSNTTSGTAIATAGTQQPSWSGGDDAYLVKFNSSGVRQWGTYCGGTGSDVGYGVEVDFAGNIFIAGTTQSSTNMTTPFTWQPTYIFYEGFVCKYNTSGTRLWGTYYGGSSDDYVYGLGLDKSGHALITGYTYSSNNIASTGAYQTSITSAPDAFLAKLDNTQGTRLWGTYYSGNSTDYGVAISTGDSNSVYLLGYTYSNTGIATTNGFQTTISNTPDLFLVRFDSLGNRVWGTYAGGPGSDALTWPGTYMCTDHQGNTFISTYYTTSNSGINDNGWLTSQPGGNDNFVMKFEPGGGRTMGSYMGGSSTDYGYGLACDQLGNIYICGMTYSSNNFATTGAHQTSIFSTPEGYLVKVSDCPLPLQPGAITGNTTVCQGSSQTYSVAAVTGATSYIWTLPGGWTGTSTTNSITVTPSATSGLIKVKAAVTCGASLERTLAVTALPEPGATITPSGPTTFCAGANVTLNANTGTGFTYVWKQGTTTLGTTTNSHVASTSGNYTVEITNSNNCVSISAPAVIVVNPNPVINFPSLSPTCTNNPNVTLNATPTGGTYTGAGVTGTTLNPSNAGPGIHTIVYSYTDSNSCTSSGNQSITVNPAPTVTLPAFSTICSDVIVPLNMAIPPGGTYSGTGVTNVPTFNPSVSGIGTFNITYTYTDGNNCTAAQTQPITVNPLTATNFPSITPKCIDAPLVNLTATPLGGTFSGPGVSGTQFNPGTGAGNHIVHYDYTNQYGCTTHDSETIVVNALPTLTFPAMDSVCNNAPLTMLANPTGGIYTGPGTGSGNILNTSQAGVGMHTITYTYTDANTCTNSTQQTVLVQPAPVINSQPALYIEICEGEALAVNVGASNVGTYQWQQNSVNIAGAQSFLYVIGSADPTHTGNYQVVITGTGACATTQLVSGTSAVLVNPLPPVNLTPASDTICNGDTLILNSGLSGNFNYQWKLNGNNISGATQPTYPVATPGTYKVLVTNQLSGCNTNSPDVVIGVSPSPDPTITYSGPTEFCDGENLAIATIDTANNVTFQWINNGNNIGGATAANYSATTSGAYQVVLTNSYNCSRTSDSVEVTVNPLPTPAIVVLDAWGNMTTGTYTYYQWNLNGNAIPNANSQTYQAQAQGNYTVTVRDSNGCENTSPVKDPLAVGNVVSGNSNFVLYPNPNAGTFVLDGTVTSTDGKAAIEIVDATGKLVYREDVKTVSDKLNKKIDISNVASGAYMIRVVSDNAREVIPFVKR